MPNNLRVLIVVTIAFLSLTAGAQVNDSLWVAPLQFKSQPVDTSAPAGFTFKMDPLQLQPIRRHLEKDYVLIEKAVFDSLIRNFYQIRHDSLSGVTRYEARFRPYVDPITGDTSYVGKPRPTRYITAKTTDRLYMIRIDKPVEPVKIDKIVRVLDSTWWKNENAIGLDLNQAFFVNWSAGGDNAIAGLFKFNFNRTYESKHLQWVNNVRVRYGLNQQEGRELRKTADELNLSSTLGYKKELYSNWYYSMRFNFSTQFTDGYKYPDTENPISRFFAPAYLFFGAGAEYQLKYQHLKVYVSPLTFKATFVHDKKLSEEGAFGVEPGKRSRVEFGTLIQATWDKELMENLAMSNSLGLYTDYFNNFGNIDINWMLNFKFRINKFLEGNLGGQLYYDDDVKYKEVDEDGVIQTYGARVQFKQHLSIGVLFEF